MKTKRLIPLIILIASLSLVMVPGLAAQPALASPLLQETAAPLPSERPIVLIESYYMDVDSIAPGKDFNLFLTLKNNGQNSAINILLTFTAGDLIPRETGGMVNLSALDPGSSKAIRQPMTVSPAIMGGGVSSLPVSMTYTDAETSQAYTASFNIALRVNYPSYAPAAPTSTPTPLTILRPQLTIGAYATDVDPLQPGVPFSLTLEVQNLGNADAKSITMITGGGSGSAGGISGTPEAGGVSGASGEFTNFAPLKSSNIHYLGDLAKGARLSVDQTLIVNTTTNPGAYSMKFSFVYVDARGVRFVDDQVITLLVYQLPLVELTFYREAGPFFVGQPGALPIQITNLSRKPVVLGNLKANVKTGGMLTNNTTLIGAMDPGGYFTLDAMLIPDLAGPMDIDVSVSYTDDFNQPKEIHQSMQITVQEQIAPPPDKTLPGGDGQPLPTPVVEETFWQKLGRLVKGLLGLDSSPSQPATNPSDMPVEPLPEQSVPGGKPIIVPGPKG